MSLVPNLTVISHVNRIASEIFESKLFRVFASHRMRPTNFYIYSVQCRPYRPLWRLFEKLREKLLDTVNSSREVLATRTSQRQDRTVTKKRGVFPILNMVKKFEYNPISVFRISMSNRSNFAN